MLEIDILAVVPGLLEGPFSHSIIARAADKNLLRIRVFDLRDFGIGQYKSGSETYRVYMKIKSVDSQQLVHEISFAKE